MASNASLGKKKKNNGVHCMAPGCTNVFYSNPSVHYHRLPSTSSSRLKQWLQAMKRKNVPKVQYARVCSVHFTEEDYVFKGTFAEDGTFKKVKTAELVSTACPSVFDFSNYDTTSTDCPTKATPNESKRQLRRKRRAESEATKQTRQHLEEVLLETTEVPCNENHDTNNIEELEFEVRHVQDVGCQTDPVIVKSVAVCTDNIEQNAQVLHDHPYFSARTLAQPLQSEISHNEPMDHAPYSKWSSSEEEEGEEDEVHSTPSKDPDFVPDDNCSEMDTDTDTDTDIDIESSSNPMFIIYKSHLLQLFKVCHEPGCKEPLTKEPECSVTGFVVTVRTECNEGHHFKWESQPRIGGIYAGNLLIPAAVFLAGNSYHNFLEVCNSLDLKALSLRQSNNIQAAFVIPEVKSMWHKHMDSVRNELKDSPLKLSGDARCDSPGHNATYGTYTLLDATSNLILAQKTVRVTDVKNSYWLEPEGLQKCLDKLKDQGLEISMLATDRHPSVAKIMREKYKTIKHEYDLWHIVKGVKKKLLAAKIPELTEWVRSVANQLWFCAATCDKDPGKLKEKWMAVLHHVTNKHEWVNGEHFHKCDHAPYTAEESAMRPWLSEDSKAFGVLQKIVMDKKLLKDLEKVTECIQTGELESIHSLYTKYAPKRRKFGRHGMKARLRLAAMDHNVSACRQHASTKAGHLRFKLEYSKAAGTYVIKPIRIQKDYSFRKELLCGIVHRCCKGPSQRMILKERTKPDPSLGEHAGIAKPDKLRSVALHVGRYVKHKKDKSN